ncbi:phosphatase PAP2 family protein [Solibacillus sp. FSL W8-0372]|uniref:phosphatase PAP2 family protein n=1 Tax=Solibacillus sp. FSL W8-0372 TaxID=2921713 RepID=UPI0030D0BF0F
MKKGAYFFALITLAIFAIISLNYNSASLEVLDAKIQYLLRGNEVIILFHYLGETRFIVMITILLLLFLWIRKKSYRGVLFVLLTIGVGNGINQLLKHYFERPRPDIADQLITYSFPSGHSQMGLLYLFTLAFLFSNMTSSRKKEMTIWGIAIVLAFFIGLARIAEGRHYPTDVLAGWSIGYSWFIICVLWYESPKHWRKK